MKINYSDIVIKGYLEIGIRQQSYEYYIEYLIEYFYKEFKKVEREYVDDPSFFGAPDFFGGCLRIVEEVKDKYKLKMNERKLSLGEQLKVAEDRSVKFSNNPDPVEDENMRIKKIENIRRKIEISDIVDFTVDLVSETGGLSANNVSLLLMMQIKDAINKAYQRVLASPQIEPKADKKIIESKSTIINKFNDVEISKVIEYFTKELVIKNYLTQSELNEYIMYAFEKCEKPTQSFQFSNSPTKAKIIKVFYKFFKDISGSPHRNQKKYAALLGEYFLGYKTANVSTNFSK